jgi:lambda family phage tail tape measure protein
MAQNVARLGVIFGMDSAEFESGLKKIGRGFDDVVSKVKYASAGVAVAFTAMSAKALQYGDQIADVAQANEVAIKTVMALSEGLAQNGGSAENAGKLLASFTAKIDDAAQGGKEAQETFARIGVSLKDLANKDMTALFDQTVMSLGRMDDAISRNAVAMSIFGKAAKGVDFVGLSEGTAEAREQFAKYAEAVKTAGELHDKLDAKAIKTTVMFTNAFIPTLNLVFDELNKTGGAMESFFKFTGEGFKALVSGVAGFVAYIKIIGQALGEINQLFYDFEQGKGFNPKERWMNLENFANIELGKAQEFANRIYYPEVYAIKPEEKKTVGRPVTPYEDKAETNRLKKEEEQRLLGIAMAGQLSIEYKRQLDFQYGILEAQGRMNFMSEKERQIAEAVAKVTDETSKKLTEIQNKREEAYAHNVHPDVLKAMDDEKQKIIELGYQYEELSRKQIETQINAQNTFMFGWDKAFKQHYEDAENYSTLGAKAFESVTNSMSSAIDNFVDNGKASFKDFTMSIIKDLVKIQLKMQAMQLFKTGMGALGTAFGGGSGMADMFAAGGGTNFGAVAAGGYMASGGPVEGNQSYIVGENGPELFMPSRSGSIVPNNKLSDMGGGQTVNYNGPYINSMSAIDTQSATQFLSKNKQTIWAVNQSASRSMPTSR